MMDQFELITNRLSKTNHRVKIEKLLYMCKTQLRFFMPFLSNEGARFLIDALSARLHKHANLRVRFLICDSPQAYRAGSLDPEALIKLMDHCNAEIAAFGNGLHAKVILVDNSTAIVTSANLTLGGLDNNFEIGLAINNPKIIENLLNEFEDAWKAVELLSAKDLADRAKWIKKITPIPEDTELPFRPKIRWRPVKTTGTGEYYGIKKFEGFKDKDFDYLDPATYGGSIDDDPAKPEIISKIKAAIDSSTIPVLRRFFFAMKDYLPVNSYLYPHYATRRRVKNFYPSAAWLGLGRNERRYVTLAQLAVGLFVGDEGAGLFANFNIGEEYEINEDKEFFLNWLTRNTSSFLELMSFLDSGYFVGYQHPDKGYIYKGVRELGSDDLKGILSVPRENLLDFHIGREYMLVHEGELIRRSSIVYEVADQFEVLYPLYLKAFKN